MDLTGLIELVLEEVVGLVQGLGNVNGDLRRTVAVSTEACNLCRHRRTTTDFVRGCFKIVAVLSLG